MDYYISYTKGTLQNDFIFNSFFSFQTEPIVTVDQGKLKGTVEKLYNGTQYFSFKGVPYAAPPVGKLRFVVLICIFFYILALQHSLKP